LKEGDILIPVIGVTGVGKSTFINAATGKIATSVSHDLDSRTQNIQPVIAPYPGDNTRRVVFLDTPGFNDTWCDDAEILRDIVNWLEDSCELGMKLAGIIYLHEISQTRFVTTGGSLTMFDTLYHLDTAQNVILATTKWKQPVIDVERNREKQLSQSWTGPHVLRFVDTHESAWEIVNHILQNDPLDTPQFHAALVTLLERLPKTKATTWEILASLFGKLFARA